MLSHLAFDDNALTDGGRRRRRFPHEDEEAIRGGSRWIPGPACSGGLDGEAFEALEVCVLSLGVSRGHNAFGFDRLIDQLGVIAIARGLNIRDRDQRTHRACLPNMCRGLDAGCGRRGLSFASRCRVVAGIRVGS